MPKPLQAPESFTDLRFPLQGIDVSIGYGMQRDGTTPLGVNVRSYEPSTLRARGGQRPGLVRWIDQQVNGLSVIQHLNVVVDPSTDALLDNQDVLGYGEGSFDFFNFFFGSPGPPFVGPPYAGVVPPFNSGYATPGNFTQAYTFPVFPPEGYVFDPTTFGPGPGGFGQIPGFISYLPSLWGLYWYNLGFRSRNPGRLIRKGGTGKRPSKNTKANPRRQPYSSFPQIPALPAGATLLGYSGPALSFVGPISECRIDVTRSYRAANGTTVNEHLGQYVMPANADTPGIFPTIVLIVHANAANTAFTGYDFNGS